MKELFKSHIPDSEAEIKQVWKDALIVFDANTILNLYRYSDSARVEFIALLKNLKPRIWTPEQAAHEYFNNRSNVIGQQTKAYEAAKKSINDLRDALRKDRGHPFIGEETMTSLVSILKKVEGELDENKEKQISRIPSDDIMTEIVKIFEARVGEKLTNDEAEKIFEEGAKRYDQKVPPGYKDAAKHENPTTFAEKRSLFGDLIVWKQIIAKAKQLKKPVIFVTDDAKEDWWLEAQGKTIGPRIELLDEFHEEVDQKLYMYRPDQFLKHAKDQLDSVVSRETIDEIRATEESRIHKHKENALSDLDLNIWTKEEQRNWLSHITNDYERESDDHRLNYLALDYRNQHRRSLTDINSFQIEYEEVQREIKGIDKDLDFLSIHLSQVTNRNDFESSEVDRLLEQRNELRGRMKNLKNRLKQLKGIIEFPPNMLATNGLRDEE